MNRVEVRANIINVRCDNSCIAVLKQHTHTPHMEKWGQEYILVKKKKVV